MVPQPTPTRRTVAHALAIQGIQETIALSLHLVMTHQLAMDMALVPGILAVVPVPVRAVGLETIVLQMIHALMQRTAMDMALLLAIDLLDVPVPVRSVRLETIVLQCW